ncbi:hypothetical protein [Brachybacterium sp. YJGR34]|uniref:DUF6912 family protein n=1 Tax=Brachybacterium sp. YJGR34 TaxID=2059911 RepID=UPI000E0BB328|nr:hypothetical protein [Brachybacterium sp. YJGR34]
MRIYLPLTDLDRPVLEHAGRTLSLEAGRPAWGVTSSARTDRPGQDEEDLEYDALQDAVHVAWSASDPAARALVIAADAPESGFVDSSEDGGAFGVRAREAVEARIASFHVTELGAADAAADDTDPALLWFDLSESAAALAYVGGHAPS